MPLASSIRRRLAIALVVVAAVPLTGCAVGLSSHAGTPFTACLLTSGVDLSAMGSWTRDEERETLSDPRALECVLTDLPVEERRDVLGWAFPDVAEDAAPEAQAGVADAVAGFLEQRVAAGGGAAADQDLADAGILLAALGMSGAEPPSVREAVALPPHLSAAGPLYEAWRESEALDDDFAARARFVEEQLAAGGALAEFFTETADALLAAQQSAIAARSAG
ncbi:hypothetical protein [Microbacterium sp. NPDC096154]|uniref:hypothetical protein n=1 Tax=Microbacterium sp. NPDC096154 TaxID=3155549 RepID=UPI00332CECFD